MKAGASGSLLHKNMLVDNTIVHHMFNNNLAGNLGIDFSIGRGDRFIRLNNLDQGFLITESEAAGLRDHSSGDVALIDFIENGGHDCSCSSGDSTGSHGDDNPIPGGLFTGSHFFFGFFLDSAEIR